MLCLLLLASLLGTTVLAAKLHGDGEAMASSAAPQTDAGSSLGAFLDAEGHLHLPPGFSGSVNPTGYHLVSGEGKALRFAPEAAKSGGPSNGDGWTSFRSIGNGCNGEVFAIAIGNKADVYVGGSFTLCADTLANGVARFDMSTQTWSSLGSGAANGVNGSVRALAVTGGTVYGGGDFTMAGGGPANNIARFDTITQTWTSLGSGATDGVNTSVAALAVSGSTVYVGGEFTQAGDAPANRVARFDTSTQSWASLGSDLTNGVTGNFVSALAVSGSAVFVGGNFIQAGGAPAARVARFDTISQTWSSLGSGAANGVDGAVRALAVSGSTLYLGGEFTHAGGSPANRVVGFDTATQTWSRLGSGAANGVNNAVVELAVSDSTLYVGGNFSQAGGAPTDGVARFDASTQTWASLGSGAANAGRFISALAVSGGTVYVGGEFNRVEGMPANNIARIDTTTQTWASLGSGWANGVNGNIGALAVSESTVYAGGEFTHAGDTAANRVARFDTSTRSWASLGSGTGNGVNDFVSALAVSGSTVYVGGNFTQAGGTAMNRVAQFDTSTQTWASLGSGTANGVNGFVSALAVSGSTVYVGGEFVQAGGKPANFVARFDTTNEIWSSLGSGATNGVRGRVNALAVSGRTLYVGGDFDQAGGEPANSVARFDTISQTWARLGSGVINLAGTRVTAIAVSGSTLYVGGNFTWAGGLWVNGVARFDTSTQTWASLGVGAANGVTGGVYRESLALAASGNMVYLGGLFTHAGGAPASRVARFDTSTATWASLGIGAANGVNGSVRALAVSSSTTSANPTLYVGGDFSNAGGQRSPNIASYRAEVVLFRNGFE